jgi:hypothetical protein
MVDGKILKNKIKMEKLVSIKKITQDEFLKSEEIYNVCSDIYINKFFLEKNFSLDDISGLLFFLYYINDEIVGFATHQDNTFFYLIDSVFNPEYLYSEHQKELVESVIKEIKELDDDVLICAYQSTEEDKDFYTNMGFTLYKDFSIQSPAMFKKGLDLTRFVLEIR